MNKNKNTCNSKAIKTVQKHNCTYPAPESYPATTNNYAAKHHKSSKCSQNGRNAQKWNNKNMKLEAVQTVLGTSGTNAMLQCTSCGPKQISACLQL